MAESASTHDDRERIANERDRVADERDEIADRREVATDEPTEVSKTSES